MSIRTIEVLEWLGTGITYSHRAWLSSGSDGFDWNKAKWVVGDFNGDGKADLVSMF